MNLFVLNFYNLFYSNKYIYKNIILEKLVLKLDKNDLNKYHNFFNFIILTF
jgi:hypothetical protein